jgi:hypothetical protein
MPGVGGWASMSTVCPSKARLLIQIKGTVEGQKVRPPAEAASSTHRGHGIVCLSEAQVNGPRKSVSVCVCVCAAPRGRSEGPSAGLIEHSLPI